MSTPPPKPDRDIDAAALVQQGKNPLIDPVSQRHEEEVRKARQQQERRLDLREEAKDVPHPLHKEFLKYAGVEVDTKPPKPKK
ncbi:hypothetical protein HK104_007396 [Borealophlyctis nickersoniae]|nr:hypothetical protein HK104_007396 [Borealophlyctis nickersoniae]